MVPFGDYFSPGNAGTENPWNQLPDALTARGGEQPSFLLRT
jgi:hypothetical protein